MEVSISADLLNQAAEKIKQLDPALADQLKDAAKPEEAARYPVVFLSPEDIAGRKGFQVVSADTHEVIGLELDDGTAVTGDCSYKGADA